MQLLLVILTFAIAVGFIFKKFIWNPSFKSKQSSNKTLDKDNIKCGKNNCGCH